MTPRNDMETADPQTHETFEGTSAGETTSTRLASTQRSRRYTRIAVSLPIVLRDQFGGREETRTQFVMIRGAVVATTSNVRVGHKLTIQIAKTGRAAECHVVGIEPVLKDVHSVEVEFTREQQDFWPVQFPPEDLKTDSGSYRFSTAVASSTLGSHSSPITDTQKSETVEPSGIGQGSREFVSLADSIAGDSFTDTAFPKTDTAFPKPEKLTPRSTPVDSVAQFRAANRAAHRREQRTKALYSALSIAGLAAAFMGGRYLIENRSEISQVRLPQVNLPSIKQVLPKAQPTEKPSAASSIDQPSLAVVTPPTPAPGLTGTPHAAPSPEAGVTPPIVFEIRSADTQVAVRHGVPLASSRKAPEDVGEEPLALPLKVDESNSDTSKPEVLNEVVAQTPMKAALLAPQPVRRAVPAKLVYSTPAQYPAMARQIRAEGEVVISLDVDASGKVSSARAVSGPPILRAAALDAVKRWRYQPATLGDNPVVSTELVRVQFKLR